MYILLVQRRLCEKRWLVNNPWLGLFVELLVADPPLSRIPLFPAGRISPADSIGMQLNWFTISLLFQHVSSRNIHLINKPTGNSFVRKLCVPLLSRNCFHERRGRCFSYFNFRQTADWRFVRRFSFVLSSACRHKRNRRPRSHFSSQSRRATRPICSSCSKEETRDLCFMIIIIIIAIRHSLSVLICSTKVDHVILSLFPITPVPPSVLSSLYRRFTLFHFQRFFWVTFSLHFCCCWVGRATLLCSRQPTMWHKEKTIQRAMCFDDWNNEILKQQSRQICEHFLCNV